MGQYSSALTGPSSSIGSPRRLKTRPSVALPTGTRTGGRYRAVHAADHAVGAAQGDATHASAAKLGLDLARKADLHAFLFGLDLHGVIDGRHVLFGKIGVERRADDLGDAAGLRH